MDYTIRPTLNYHLGLAYNVWEFTNNPLVTDYNAVSDIGLKGATVNRMFPRFNLGAQELGHRRGPRMWWTVSWPSSRR